MKMKIKIKLKLDMFHHTVPLNWNNVVIWNYMTEYIPFQLWDLAVIISKYLKIYNDNDQGIIKLI